jgi:hypothetical protein
MQLYANNKPVVRYREDTARYLNELIDILFEMDYFSFEENTKQYVSDMEEYVEQNILYLPKYTAPPISLNIRKVCNILLINSIRGQHGICFFYGKITGI